MSKRVRLTQEDDDFYLQNVNFLEDYQRNNPVTSKNGWENWLKLVEGIFYLEQKGKGEKIIREKEIAEANPNYFGSVTQYAKIAIEQFKNSVTNVSIGGSKKSVLRTITRNSAEFYIPPEYMPTTNSMRFSKH